MGWRIVPREVAENQIRTVVVQGMHPVTAYEKFGRF
jgi:hypothetical protein